MMTVPAMPCMAFGGRAPDVLSTFFDGRASADIWLEPRPASNRSLSISLPWNAEVASASLTVGPADRIMTHSSSPNALELSQLPMENLTLSGQSLQLSRSGWNWSQSPADLGECCTASGGVLEDGFRIAHSNPALSYSGGGIWRHRIPVVVSEQGGTARTNESVNLRIAFDAGTCINPHKEVRLTDSAGAEQPVLVQSATYYGNQCTAADMVFVLPSLGASSTTTYYVYSGNPDAARPSYDRRVYFAEPFAGPALHSRWTVSNLDGLSYSASGSLRVRGTATSEFWQGSFFESPVPFPGSFDVWLSLRLDSATGTGHTALLSVVQDAQNSVNLGLQYDSYVGGLSPGKFTLGRTVAGSSTIDYTADAGSPGSWHALRLACAAGTFSGYIDGNLLGSVDLSLSAQGLRLSAAARAVGDTVDVAFDELLVSSGFSFVSAKDPVPALQPGATQPAGYNASATITSPLLENAGLLPMGTVRLAADTPAGTCCTISVLGPSNETLAQGLTNGQKVPLSPRDIPSFRLQAVLVTADSGATARLRSWGVGDLWEAGVNASGEYLSFQDLALSAGGIALARAPDRWNKSAQAALNLGVASTFDDLGVSHPWVLRAEGEYRMYYAGYDGTRWRIGLATSADGATWTRYPDNPVMVPGGGWESSHIDWPCVVYNGHGYEMWYAGSADGGSTYKIGHATSGDGISWTKSASNPVLGPGAPGSWSSSSVLAPRVLLDGSNYTMWFSGKGTSSTSIGQATSADGIVWTQSLANPVLGPAAPGWSSQGVLPGGLQRLADGTYRLWYAGFNATFLGVGLAESPDGLVWTARAAPVLSNGTGGAFDRSGAGYPAVMFENNCMWYTAYDGARSRIGLARPCLFANGSLLSAPVDLGTAPAALRMTALFSVPAQTNLSIQARTSWDGDSWSGWTALGASPTPVPAGRLIQWAASFISASNDSTPVAGSVTAAFEYYHGSGELEFPPVSLRPSQVLASIVSTHSSIGGGVVVSCSIDNGTGWDPLEPGVPRNLTGTHLRLRTVLSGNHTTTPRLSGVAYSYTYDSFPQDCALDAGADGAADWSFPGVLTGSVAAGDLARALNAWLDAHRNDTGDTRLVPLSFSSATSSAINASGLNVVWSPRTFVNNPPRIESRAPERARLNELYIYVVVGRDADRRDRLTYRLEVAPERMVISETTGELTWQPYPEDAGYHTIRISVSDGKASAFQEYTLVVSQSAVNNPPHLSGAPAGSATVGIEYRCAFNATDPDGDRVRFSLSRAAPPGAAIDEDTGQFSWIPAPAPTGQRDLEVLASDGTDTVRFGFSVNVSSEGQNSLPVVTSNAMPTARANMPYIYELRASDADGDSLTFGLALGPANATLSPGGVFSWTPVVYDSGIHNIIIRVSDGKGYILYNFTVRVMGSNRPPIFLGGPDSPVAWAGRAWTFQARASDADGDALVYTLILGPAGMRIDSSTGVLNWTPPSSLSGSYQVRVNVSDGVSAAFLDFTLRVEGKSAPKGLLDQYGLIFMIIMVVVIAGGGAAAVMSGRRKATVAAEATETRDGTAAEPGAATGPEAGAALSKPRIISLSGAGLDAPRAGESSQSDLPPPEPASATVAEPMKPAGTISKELPDAAQAPTGPAAPSPAQATPPAPGQGAGAEPAPQQTQRPIIAPPLAPTLTQPAAALQARTRAQAGQQAPPAPASAAPQELYKPIPGPYDDRPLGLEAPAPAMGPPGAPMSAMAQAPEPARASMTSSLDNLMAEMEGGPAKPAPPPQRKEEPGGLSEDMDFIASFLQGRDRAKDEKVVEKSTEWSMLKDFTKELETVHQKPVAKAEPADKAQPAGGRRGEPLAEPKQPDAPKKPEGSLSLDDILNELES